MSVTKVGSRWNRSGHEGSLDFYSRASGTSVMTVAAGGMIFPNPSNETDYHVDAAASDDNGNGLGWGTAFQTITTAFAAVSSNDRIFIKQGGYTGNFTTPVNATASFVSVIGITTHDQGLAPYLAASSSSSPLIDVLARGWSFQGLEFDCPTSSSGIRLTKSVDGTTNRPDFATIKNCIFTTGKYGVEVNGGGTHVTIRDCKFDQLTSSGAFAIHVTDTSHQIPAFWLVRDNYFLTNTDHIGPGNATYGWNNSTFQGNVFDNATTTTLDIRASGGIGNIVIGNYFDVAAAAFNSTDIIGNTTDFAAGNHFNDVDQTLVLPG